MKLDYINEDELFQPLVDGVVTIRPQYGYGGKFDPKVLSVMMDNLTVSTPVLRIVRDLVGRDLNIEPTTDEYSPDDLKAIQSRFSNIPKFDDAIHRLAMTPFTEFCVHEKVYEDDPDTGGVRLSQLIYIPREYIKFDYSRVNNNEGVTGWYINLNGDEIPITHEKFLLSVYQPDVNNPMGYGLLRYGMKQAFDDFNSLEAKVRALQLKYGDSIPVFGYDPKDDESPEGRAKLKARAEGIKKMNGANVLGVPLGGYESKLSESFHVISLADLKIEMHNYLISRMEAKIEIFIMGAMFSKADGGGSYARDSVQADEKTKIVDSIGRFVSCELNKLLQFDALYHGNDYGNNYSFDFKAILNESEHLDIETKRAGLDKIKIETMTLQSGAMDSIIESVGNMKFLGIPVDTIERVFDVDREVLEAIPVKEKVKQTPPMFGGNFSKKIKSIR